MVQHPIVTDLVVVKPLTGEEVARLAIPQYVLDYIELGQHAPGMDGDSMSEDDDPNSQGLRDGETTPRVFGQDNSQTAGSKMESWSSQWSMVEVRELLPAGAS